MRGKRFTEEQIVAVLKESAAGMRTEEVCRRHGICSNTFYRWKAKYADMEISDVRNQCWFSSLEDAKITIEAWRFDYNAQRPHMLQGAPLSGEQGKRARPDHPASPLY